MISSETFREFEIRRANTAVLHNRKINSHNRVTVSELQNFYYHKCYLQICLLSTQGSSFYKTSSSNSQINTCALPLSFPSNYRDFVLHEVSTKTFTLKLRWKKDNFIIEPCMNANTPKNILHPHL